MQIISKTTSSTVSSMTEEEEFVAMVAEFRPFAFKSSAEVSQYIRKNNLGNKYKRLSGELEISNDGDAWVFSGAINPRFYARLCSELGLNNKSTKAVPGRFTSEEDRKFNGI